MKKIPLLLFLLCIFSVAKAEITLPAVIGDNMIIQRDTYAALWGTATPGKKVTITPSWSGDKTVVTADAQTGQWQARIKTPAAGGPYDITFTDGKALTIKNVLSGDVWFCSGQSNMEMPVKGYDQQPAFGGTDKIVNAKASRQIRICNVTRCSSTTVKETVQGEWSENTPATVAETSATAYFFADYLQSAIDVPVGIIVSSWGGSSIEAWMTREVIEKEFSDSFSLDHLDGKAEIRQPHQDPCLLYNGQVAAIVPFTVKGFLWYQGEANRSVPQLYTKLQTSYVKMMRELFAVPQAPFYFVQIAPYNYSDPDGFKSGYFCEAQQKTLKTIPNSGMVVTIDIGAFNTIHPCRKDIVGQRLALLAIEHTYGCEAVNADAPLYKKVDFADGKAFVTVETDYLWLNPMGMALEGFELAGEDKVFHKAVGRLVKDKRFGRVIEVTSGDVRQPVAVRYCFRNWCTGTVFSNYGIPLAPFRSDDWDDIEK